MKQILKVVVGSRLHGLDTNESDWDYRGVFINPLKDILSPFKKERNRSWIEGDEDNTIYELRDFVKLAAQGNFSILEVLHSYLVKETNPLGEELLGNKRKFYDSKKMLAAARGYASNQLKKADFYNPTDRTPKTLVAYLRTMYQAEYFFLNDQFTCIPSAKQTRFLMKIKKSFNPEMIGMVSDEMYRIEQAVQKAYDERKVTHEPDIEWIENFLIKAYK